MDVCGEPASACCGVYQQWDSMSISYLGNLSDPLDGAQFMVGMVNPYQEGVLPDGFFYRGRIDTADRIDADPRNFGSLFLQLLQSVQQRGMFNLADHEMVALNARGIEQPLDRHVDGFGTGRGENDFLGVFGFQKGGHLLSRMAQSIPNTQAFLVDGRRAAKVLLEKRLHGFRHRRREGRGGHMIKIKPGHNCFLAKECSPPLPCVKPFELESVHVFSLGFSRVQRYFVRLAKDI